VVKSDAYGHGLLPVARTLAEEGVYGFGVSEVFEGLRLREAGFRQPIILLSGFESHWLPEIVRLRLTPVVTDLFQLEELVRYASARDLRVAIHLKVDTGMNRFGLVEREFEKALDLLDNSPSVFLEGLMSHLSCSERPEDPLTREQIRRFARFRERLLQSGF